MEKVVSATEARVHFGEMMQNVVAKNQTIVVERSGKPQIVMMSIAQYEHLKEIEGNTMSWTEKLHQTRALVKAELGDRKLPPPEEIIRQMREERDEKLLDLS